MESWLPSATFSWRQREGLSCMLGLGGWPATHGCQMRSRCQAEKKRRIAEEYCGVPPTYMPAQGALRMERGPLRQSRLVDAVH